MFSLLKSREKKEKEKYVFKIGKMLFKQIATIRDMSKLGKIKGDELNTRINSMFTAGYILGYVDEHLSIVFTDEKNKKKYAKQIYESIFPGSGIKFIEAKITARALGDTISEDNEHYIDAQMKINDFDLGVSAARYEVSEFIINKEHIPDKLRRFLATGQIE
jgi:hypothetical protein